MPPLDLVLYWACEFFNFAIFLSYLLIPVGLLQIVRQNWQSVPPQFRLVGFEFSLFIFSCSMGHLVHAIAPWLPHAHTWATLIHGATAAISARTALRMPEIGHEICHFIRGCERTAKALTQSEERFRAFANNSPAVKSIKDCDRNLVYANHTFKRVFGEIPYGLKDEEWLPEESAKVTIANDLQVLRTGQAIEVMEMVPVRGKDHHWLVQKFRFGEPGKYCLGVVAIDITAQQAIEQELRRSNQELEQFAYVASHDLAQPLRAISGFSEHLLNHLQSTCCLDAETEGYINRVLKASGRMKALLEGLLAYSRIGRKETTLILVPLQKIVAGVVEDLHALIEERNTTICVGELPIAGVDEVQISQVFANLIANAIKYTPSEQRPEIRIGCVNREDAIAIYVRDNGEGIAPEHAETVFQVFQRLHGTEIEGSGMGLAVCKKIVENLGGRMWLRSRPGEGSTFWFSLPKH